MIIADTLHKEVLSSYSSEFIAQNSNNITSLNIAKHNDIIKMIKYFIVFYYSKSINILRNLSFILLIFYILLITINDNYKFEFTDILKKIKAIFTTNPLNNKMTVSFLSITILTLITYIWLFATNNQLFAMQKYSQLKIEQLYTRLLIMKILSILSIIAMSIIILGVLSLVIINLFSFDQDLKHKIMKTLYISTFVAICTICILNIFYNILVILLFDKEKTEKTKIEIIDKDEIKINTFYLDDIDLNDKTLKINTEYNADN